MMVLTMRNNNVERFGGTISKGELNVIKKACVISKRSLSNFFVISAFNEALKILEKEQSQQINQEVINNG